MFSVTESGWREKGYERVLNHSRKPIALQDPPFLLGTLSLLFGFLIYHMRWCVCVCVREKGGTNTGQILKYSTRFTFCEENDRL